MVIDVEVSRREASRRHHRGAARDARHQRRRTRAQLTASPAIILRKLRMSAPSRLRLGVNIDHVATVRNARGGHLPDPLRAARLAAAAGADGITAHLREDRRHIVDADIEGLMRELDVPLNFEMAATEEMVGIALRHRPHAACIVPEKREERTTEGGLDAAGQHNHLKPMVARLRDAGIRVSLFIEADPRQLEAAVTLGAPVVELHTGRYCEIEGAAQAGRARAHRQGRGALRQARPRMPCRPWPELRRRRRRSPPSPKCANSTSAISWSARRSSSGSKPRSARCAASWMRRGRGERPRDPRHRQRPLRHPAHREIAGALRRPLRAA